MRSCCRIITILFVGLTFFRCSPELPEDVALAMKELPDHLDFNIHVKPILSDKCFACHGPDKDKVKAGLQLYSSALAFKELPESPGKFAITPGSLRKSQLFHRIISSDEEYRMPGVESNLTLSAHEKAVLIRWIEEGAVYKPHWALIKPEKKDLPAVKNKEWVANEIDNFILAKIEQAGLTPSASAEKEILLRRVSLDLTGLPPTPAEIDNFLADQSPDAYEKQVDRLLASPHYGEKMALHWMDISRFADTHGYTVDRYRDMSPYRDWVIKSFNENLSYDKFVTWQLAGDLLPDATYEQKLATAFNRIHPQNMEGGIVREEFRVEYVVDRVNTTSQAFMALTVGCARCHDHKFDPISQKNYYQLFSFFNNVNEEGQISWDDAMPVPTIIVPDQRKDSIVNYLNGLIADKEHDIDIIKREGSGEVQNWMASGQYLKYANQIYPKNIQAHFSFDQKSLTNKINTSQRGAMKQNATNGEKAVFAGGIQGDGLLLNGDAWFDLNGIGAFGRAEPFSVGLWAKVPKDISDGVIFHNGDGAVIYNFRGYRLELLDNKLYVMMAHTAPDNAIIEFADKPLPRDEWVHLMITYDGSSIARGLKLYMNSEVVNTTIEVDNLYKDILFRRKGQPEPGIQIGALWRGKGVKGTIVDDIVVFNRELSPLEVIQISFPKRYRAVLSTEFAQLDNKQKIMLEDFYWRTVSEKLNKPQTAVTKHRITMADSLESRQEVMVMKEMENPRQAYVLKRGQYDAYGEEVTAGVPESILPMAEDLPRNRMGLALWLMDDEHPLTARVAVNRFWQMLFGKGIVRTSEDFGNQGEMPSHPLLLDWLAINFRESGWDIKATLKKMAMSAAYKQSSKFREDLMERDPDNRLLARGPAKRLSGEMLRDNALAASGLLVDEIGGPSVSPYQPPGLWKINGAEYRQDSGKKLYRRSLYTIWKRTVPHPSIATFDSPARSECIVRRQETNTPLQALVLLNDPTYVEAARVLGEQMSDLGNNDKPIKDAYLKLAGRLPNEAELKLMIELREREYQKFKSHPDKIRGWIAAGAFAVPKRDDLPWVAANAVVASTIMNSDATITKR